MKKYNVHSFLNCYHDNLFKVIHDLLLARELVFQITWVSG